MQTALRPRGRTETPTGVSAWDLVVAKAAARSATRRYGRLAARRAPETEVFVARLEALRCSERAETLSAALAGRRIV